jgi:hypothetical protein
VAPHVVLHPGRGQNRHSTSHSIPPPVERTGVAAWLSSPGTAIPASRPWRAWPGRRRDSSGTLLQAGDTRPSSLTSQTLSSHIPLTFPSSLSIVFLVVCRCVEDWSRQQGEERSSRWRGGMHPAKEGRRDSGHPARGGGRPDDSRSGFSQWRRGKGLRSTTSRGSGGSAGSHGGRPLFSPFLTFTFSG